MCSSSKTSSSSLEVLGHKSRAAIVCYLRGKINLKHLSLCAELLFMSYKWLSLRKLTGLNQNPASVLLESGTTGITSFVVSV